VTAPLSLNANVALGNSRRLREGVRSLFPAERRRFESGILLQAEHPMVEGVDDASAGVIALLATSTPSAMALVQLRIFEHAK
jgi:hypothetical protein